MNLSQHFGFARTDDDAGKPKNKLKLITDDYKKIL